MIEQWLRWGSKPWVPVLLAGLIVLPSLSVGWFLDDLMHAAAARGALPFGPEGLDLFSFAGGSQQRHHYLIGHGLPWWTAPELSLRFWRPLSSAILLVLHRSFGDAPWVAHCVGIGLYVATVAAVWCLLRRALGERLGGLAALIFALDDGHALPAVWPANHNALVSAASALWGLVAWLRWREDHWKPGAYLAWAGWAVGLCGGETALGALALPVAYELLGGPDRNSKPARRFLAIGGLGALVAAWAVVYKLGGYGSHHSGAYIDPVREPAAFWAAAAIRLPALVGAALLRIPVEIGVAAPVTAVPFALVGGVVGGAFAWVLTGASRSLPEPSRRHLAWLLLGGSAAALPACATFAAARLLTIPSIAVAAALAVVAAATLQSVGRALDLAGQSTPAWQRRLAGATLIAHLVVAPLGFMAAQAALGLGAARFDALTASPALDAAVGRIAILPLVPDLTAAWVPVARLARGQRAPAEWVPLCAATTDVRLVAQDAHTLQVWTVSSPMIGTEAEQLVRTPHLRFAPGQRVALDVGEVEVLRVDGAGRPLGLALHTFAPLSDPRHAWLRVDGPLLLPLVLPEPGRELLLVRRPGIVGI